MAADRQAGRQRQRLHMFACPRLHACCNHLVRYPAQMMQISVTPHSAAACLPAAHSLEKAGGGALLESNQVKVGEAELARPRLLRRPTHTAAAAKR